MVSRTDRTSGVVTHDAKRGAGGLFSRLHRFIAVPTVELEEKYYELYAVTNWAMAIGLVSHASFIPMFWLLGAPQLAVVNVGSAACFVVALWMSRRANLLPSLILGVTEVALHAWIATLYYGLASLFHIHMLLGLELLVLFSWVSLRWRLLFAGSVAASYIALMFVAYGAEPVQAVSVGLGAGFAVFNAVIFTSVTTGMLAYFTWTVQQNRDARDGAREQVLARTHDLEEKNSRLIESELALAAARDLAEEGSRAKSMFLANMSHELRTPLNAIIGYAEMIAEDAEEQADTGLAEEVSRIQGAGRHLLSLINDILDLSKIEAGRMELERVDFRLAEILRDVVDTARPLADKNENELVVQPALGTAECDALGRLFSDATKVRQILFNLLSNAVKFTEGGTVRLEIERTPDAVPGGERITFRVSDTGIGMDDATMERVFGEFAQADESTTRKYGGTGLGLTITHRFVEMLGGQISVRSEVGEGSSFTVWLPAKAPSATAVADPSIRAAAIRTVSGTIELRR